MKETQHVNELRWNEFSVDSIITWKGRCVRGFNVLSINSQQYDETEGFPSVMQ